MHVLKIAIWDTDLSTKDSKNIVVNNKFSGCILLKHLVGFFDDYKSSLLEKHRFTVISVLAESQNNLLQQYKKIDSCNLKNFKIYLNSEVLPHNDFKADF